MTITLENAAFYLVLDPHRNLFSVRPHQANAPEIAHAHFSVRYRRGLLRHFQGADLAGSVSDTFPLAGQHGEMRARTARYGPNRHGLIFDMTFALPREAPLLLWKMRISNRGLRPVEIGRIELLRVGFTPVSQLDRARASSDPLRGSFAFPVKNTEPAFYSNGWGSWNHTGAFGLYDLFRRTRFRWFTGPMRINPGTPQPRARGHFASDMYGILGDRNHRGGLVIGFLSQKQHFGSMEILPGPLTPALSLWANGDETALLPGEAVETDWACLQPLHLDSADPQRPYLEAVMREHGLDRNPETGVPVGWCSWYQYFQQIDAPVISENLARAADIAPEVPLDLIQIDDGWQAQIGDWDSFSPGFPGGPAPLAREIRSGGFTPGLWLAPFILHPRADIVKEKPEWILRNRLGVPANAGFVWNTFTRALDLSIPAALDHAVESVGRAAREWGYPYLKLDFLYAGALGGQRADRSRTRAQILRHALERIREAVGEETTLLACGCPLGSAIGVFDAMRINADVAPHWFPRFLGHERIFRKEPDFPSARNAIQNALTRAPLHRRWWVNDPDCLLLRPDSDLSLAEVRSLATVIALSGGSLLLSDDLTALPAERLRIARRLLPVIGQRPQVIDWFDEAMPARVRLDLTGPAGPWHLLAVFNWAERQADGRLDVRDYLLDPGVAVFARAFWSGQLLQAEDGRFDLPSLEPHGCALLAVRPERPGVQYLGSDLHISQGLELVSWRTEPGRVLFEIERPGREEGKVFLKLPGAPLDAPVRDLGKGIYELAFDFHKHFQVDIRYE